jgi:AraC-like DNA-binding protein
MPPGAECLLPCRIDDADIGTMKTLELGLVTGLFARQEASPFFIKDADLRYVAANPAMARLCGARSVAAMIGKRASAFFPRPAAARYEALDAAVLTSGTAIIDKLELAIGHGAQAWLLFSRLPVRDAAEQIIGVAASARWLADVARAQPGYARAAAAVAELESRFDTPLDIVRLAGKCGVSASQLERDFHSLFGMAPQRYLHKLRIEQALALLAGDATVASIAQACGYADQSAFTRRFRTDTGLTPTEWRQRNRKAPQDERQS